MSPPVTPIARPRPPSTSSRATAVPTDVIQRHSEHKSRAGGVRQRHNKLNRHPRRCAEDPRLSVRHTEAKAWMLGTSPSMTGGKDGGGCLYAFHASVVNLRGRKRMNLGYIGLGRMGGALVRRLLPHVKLRVHDLNPEAVARFAAVGALPAQDLPSLAHECDIVMTCLPTSKEVRDVVFGEHGLARHLKRGSLVVDMTTANPNDTKEIAARLKEQGIDLIDAPVSGGPHGADAGTIAILV